MTLDNRIGTYNDDGSVQSWPVVTITGRSYRRPVSITRLSARHFCVTDNEPVTVDQRDALIASLKEQVHEPAPDRKTSRRTRRSADPLDDAVSDPEE